MKRQLIKILERILPAATQRAARAWWLRRKNRKFRSQGASTLSVSGVELEIPALHPLPGLLQASPLRDRCVGITARLAGEKYPKATIIDIGANIGDTAAMIAEYCSNPLLLVEASDFYIDYLRKNAAKLKNKVEVREVLVGDGRHLTGELFHWGGTAEWKELPNSQTLPTVKLGSLTQDPVCFIKSDTDGHDFKILLSDMEWLANQRPILLLESQVRNSGDLQTAEELLDALQRAGYSGFIVWDDAGNHVLSTSDPEVVKDVNRHLLTRLEHGATLGISNFDMACFPAKDQDLFENAAKWWRSQPLSPANAATQPSLP